MGVIAQSPYEGIGYDVGKPRDGENVADHRQIKTQRAGIEWRDVNSQRQTDHRHRHDQLTESE